MMGRQLQSESAKNMLGYLKSVESSARSYVTDFPIVIERGKDSKVFDSDGKAYIDCLAGAGTLALGHNHQIILDTMKQFLDSGHIMHGLDLATPLKNEFTHTLLDCFPQPFRQNAKIQFCGPTGADAVEAAIKLFKTATKRSTIVAFHGAYHGMSHGSLALTGNLKAKKEVKSLMPDVHFLPFPYMYRCPFGLGTQESIEVNLNYIRNVLTDPCSGIVKPAAIILEIVQGEGGCIPADDDWVRGVRKITRDLDIPLIIDEIQTGLGRTGNMFAFESSDIVPDAVLVSKAIGGGLPLSALIYDKKYDLWSAGAHAGTFRGNQMAMAAGIATIHHIKEKNIIPQCREKGEFIISKLHQLQKICPIIGDVRGRGLMIGLEIVDPNRPKDGLGNHPNSPEITAVVKEACFQRGLIIESGGRYNSVLRLLPPLIISMNEINEVIEILESSLMAANLERISGSLRMSS